MLQSSELVIKSFLMSVFTQIQRKKKENLKESYSFYFSARLAKMSIMSLVKLIALLLNFKKGG